MTMRTTPDKSQLLAELEDAGDRARRRALVWSWLSVGAAGLAVAAIVAYGGAKVKDATAELGRLKAAAADEEKVLAGLKRQNDDLKTTNEKLESNIKRLSENYSTAVAAAESTKYLRPDRAPASVDPPARVYLQIVSDGDRAFAAAIGKRLGNYGFRSMGVELVERAARLKNSEVRYYKKVDEDGARRLQDALEKEGVSTALLYLNLETARVRANHFEVWFAAGVSQRGQR
jgi:cell division protein FtsB